MSDTFYGNKPINEVSSYYGISERKNEWMLKDCEKIQQAFINHAIILTLRECEDIYRIYSDEFFCASWEGGIEDFSEEAIFEILYPVLKMVINDRITRLENIIEQVNEYDGVEE